MVIKIKRKEGPKEIKNPKIKKKLFKAFYKSLIEHESHKDIKKLLYYYYRFYPKNFVEGIAWTKQILSEEDIGTFVDQGVLVRSKDVNMVKLGPTGLSLISMWNTEKLTKWVIALTLVALIIGISSLISSFLF